VKDEAEIHEYGDIHEAAIAATRLAFRGQGK
jgi:hypothetical protein